MARFQRVQPGQKVRIQADTWNAMAAAAEAHQDSQRNTGIGAPAPVGHNGIVLVKNSSGTDASRFGILGLGAPIITAADNLAEFKSRITFIGASPTTGTHERKFAVCLEPIKNGAIGQGLIQGIIQTQLDVLDADHKFADIKSTDLTQLQTGFVGAAEIMWQASGTGTQWAIVRIGLGPGLILGKTDASHAKGASGTVSVYTGTPGSETDTGQNVTAYNKFAAIGSGKWVMLCHNGFGYYEIAAEC